MTQWWGQANVVFFATLLGILSGLPLITQIDRDTGMITGFGVLIPDEEEEP